MDPAELIPGIYVGVDSGGTRTNVDIERVAEDGARLSTSYEVSESLSGALPPASIPEVLQRILAPLESRLESLDTVDDDRVRVWVSAAGFTSWTRDDYLVALEDVGTQVLGDRVTALAAANDAVSLLLGMRADVIIIAGTGSSVLLQDRDGALMQAGGHEWVACDYGSGFWIGLRAIRRAYRDFEAGEDTSLLQRLRQTYGIRPDDDRGLIAKLRDLAIADPHMKKEIARFTISTCAAAERGDAAAQNIVKAEAEDLADVTAGALRRHFMTAELSEGLHAVQCGSLLANEFYRTSFEQQLAMRLRTADDTARLEWGRVSTGGEAAVQLAKDLSGHAAAGYLRIGRLHRPAMVLL